MRLLFLSDLFETYVKKRLVERNFEILLSLLILILV